MNGQVQRYLTQVKFKNKIERDRILILAGLYEKDYGQGLMDPSTISPEMRFYYDSDYDLECARPFKKIPLEVTDEEYEIIRKNVLGLDGEYAILQRLDIQTAILKTIKACVIFFVVLAIISIIGGLILIAQL